MNTAFQVEIGFVEDGASSDLLTIGGRMISGELRNGSTGYVEVDSSRVELTVKEIAFLKGAKPDAIMFTVLKPNRIPEFNKWTGSQFVSN
jgi:hypothetical protein